MSVTAFTGDELRALYRKMLLPRLVCLPVGVIGIILLRRGWPSDGGLVVALISACTAYAFFCATSCFHECSHQTLTARSWFDVWLGRALGTLMLTPYTAYREAHIRHHAYLNKPQDWELWPYADPNCSAGFRRLFAWLDLVFGSLTAPLIYGRIYFSRESPLRNSAVRRTIFLEYLAIVMFWGAVLCDEGRSDQWTAFIRSCIVPWWLAGIIQSGRKFTEHLGMASYDPLLGTRTVLGGGWMTRLLTYVNFDIFIHGPHHRHPRVAHNELESRMADYIKQNPGVHYPVYGNYWQATYAMLPSLIVNPGCGMNAGASAPGKQVDVGDFVADVTAEVPALEGV